MNPRQRARVLIVVKAQPALSKRHGEVVCVAGVRVDGDRPEWIRLFPVPFRDLPAVTKFKKYQFVDLEMRRSTSDTRPESFLPSLSTAQLGDVIDSGPSGTWRRRWEVLEPLAGQHTMCALNRGQRDGHQVPSLAMVKPRQVIRVHVTDTPDYTDLQRAMAAEAAAADLFGEEREPLEPPPFAVKYEWLREDDQCQGHLQTLVDWEVGAAGRNWSRHADREQVRRQLRTKFHDQLCAMDRDTYFFVGNQHQHPGSYLVLGVFWPKKDPGRDQLTLGF